MPKEGGEVPPGSRVPAALHTVLTLVARREVSSRAEIALRTGLARSTVGQQVDELIGRGIVLESLAGKSVRGRPPRALTINPAAGTLAVAQVGTAATGVAVTDLTGELIEKDELPIRVDAGPEPVLEAIVERIRSLLADNGRDPTRVRQVVVGLPGPVDFRRRCAVRPPIMPGWDGYPVGQYLERKLAAPAIVDNGVNLMAIGEVEQGGETPLLFVEVGIGIGSSLVTAEGSVHRGAEGAAGDIGHIRVPEHTDALCECGQTGCLDALASCRAILATLGIPESTDDDPGHGLHALSQCLADGDARTLHEVRRAGNEIGEIAAMLVHVNAARRSRIRTRVGQDGPGHARRMTPRLAAHLLAAQGALKRHPLAEQRQVASR
jgi:predicted NBD/HSP70 family sugar kinase